MSEEEEESEDEEEEEDVIYNPKNVPLGFVFNHSRAVFLYVSNRS